MDFRQQSYLTHQRPTQKSMIQTYSRSPQPRINLEETTHMAMSFISNHSPEESPTLKHSVSYNPKSFISFTPNSKINHEEGTTSAALRQKLKFDSNPEDTLRTNLKKEALMKQILEEVREKMLPSLVQMARKEVLGEILSLQTEVQSLREELRSSIRKQDNVIFQLSMSTSQKENVSSDLGTKLLVLENKILQMQGALNSSVQEIKSLQIKIGKSGREIRLGKMKSSLPPLLLEYRESMRLKGEHQIEFLIGQTMYCVDREGFLLDHENYYILDERGSKIRLEEKHLKFFGVQSKVQ